MHHFLVIRVNSNSNYSPETGQNRRFFCPVWAWNLTDDLEKQQDAVSVPMQDLCIIFVAMWEFKLELRSRNAQTGAKFVLTSMTLSFNLWPWHFAWTSLLSMLQIPVWQTNNRMDNSVLIAAWSQLKICTCCKISGWFNFGIKHELLNLWIINTRVQNVSNC